MGMKIDNCKVLLQQVLIDYRRTLVEPWALDKDSRVVIKLCVMKKCIRQHWYRARLPVSNIGILQSLSQEILDVCCSF